MSKPNHKSRDHPVSKRNAGEALRSKAASRADPEVTVRDYNGEGLWTAEAIRARYLEYARRCGITSFTDLTPTEHCKGLIRWVYPVMDKVIEGIKNGDRACIALGLDFIEEDARFPFGMVLKSNTARALRRADLLPHDQDRIRKRVVNMLIAGQVPREFREYAKLARKVGIGQEWYKVEALAPRNNIHVLRYLNYFRRHVLPRESAEP